MSDPAYRAWIARCYAAFLAGHTDYDDTYKCGCVFDPDRMIHIVSCPAHRVKRSR